MKEYQESCYKQFSKHLLYNRVQLKFLRWSYICFQIQDILWSPYLYSILLYDKCNKPFNRELTIL